MVIHLQQFQSPLIGPKGTVFCSSFYSCLLFVPLHFQEAEIQSHMNDQKLEINISSVITKILPTNRAHLVYLQQDYTAFCIFFQTLLLLILSDLLPYCCIHTLTL